VIKAKNTPIFCVGQWKVGQVSYEARKGGVLEVLEGRLQFTLRVPVCLFAGCLNAMCVYASCFFNLATPCEQCSHLVISGNIKGFTFKKLLKSLKSFLGSVQPGIFHGKAITNERISRI